ncbi:hypothetical protein AOQ87_01205 [Candidatus Riesia pediculischaeffi]|uniref:CMP/dCMP-type deaminase domain-containing protein n=2 Tax=Candidatus Riesia pediculischaeffi TaxID=428411 RepID=A0A1V0HKE9_9ENTR|nr:hypothetical protein AOQ87_01205 [Candidatus Riesia pediculischaeffi]
MNIYNVHLIRNVQIITNIKMIIKPHLNTEQLKKDFFWMEKSINFAKRAELIGEVPIGSVLVYRDNMVASGWNEAISQKDPSAHAEIVSIRNGAKYFENYRLKEDVTMYVTVFPCIMCIGAIFHARIRRLVYGAENYKNSSSIFFENLKGKNNNMFGRNRIDICGGILSDNCSAILKNFFKKRRKVSNLKTVDTV